MSDMDLPDIPPPKVAEFGFVLLYLISNVSLTLYFFEVGSTTVYCFLSTTYSTSMDPPDPADVTIPVVLLDVDGDNATFIQIINIMSPIIVNTILPIIDCILPMSDNPPTAEFAIDSIYI